MAEAGANYIRNTMSDRDPGDVRAFARNTDDGNVNLWVPDGKYIRQWLKIFQSQWTSEETIEASEGKLSVRNDESAYWFCLVTKA